MKKLLVILVAVVAMGAFSSCAKTCTCETYAAGVVVSSVSDVDLSGDYKQCSDMNTSIEVLGKKNGVECK